MKYEDFSSVRADQLVSSSAARPSSHYQMWGKRLLDLMLALVALPIVAVVFAAVWISNLGSGQKTIFAQPRVGKNGRVFTCYKFQTMVDDAEAVLRDLCRKDPEVKAEWDQYQKLKNDPRVTKAGKFLRKTSLDELPQVLNVLLGDMSLVGPRPFMVDQDEIYRSAGGSGYYDLKPGITGLWQVEGRGQSSFASRVTFDNTYRKSVSVGKDIGIMVATISVVAGRSGT